MRKLYEIEADILACLDTETGEVIDLEKLNALNVEREKKITGVICACKNEDAEIESLKAEIDRLTKRKKAAENKKAGYLKWLDGVLHGEKFTSVDKLHKASYRKSRGLVYAADFDVSILPADMVKTEVKPIAKEVTAALDNGAIFPGVILEERNNLVLR